MQNREIINVDKVNQQARRYMYRYYMNYCIIRYESLTGQIYFAYITEFPKIYIQLFDICHEGQSLCGNNVEQ